MTQSTIVRAERAAKRKNKRLRERLPLLASELAPGGALESWPTTEQAEAERLERIAERVQQARATMHDFAEEMSERALQYRDLLAQHISAELLTALDTYAAQPWITRVAEPVQLMIGGADASL